MKNVLKGLQNVENTVMAIAFAVMVVSMFAQVVNRNILQLPVSGFEELARYCMVYMVLLGTELGLRDGTQISVTAVVDHLHGAAKEVVQVIAKLIVIGFSAIMFYESMGMVMTQISSGQTSASLQIPMAIPYAALPISFGLICVVQIGLLVKLFLPGQSEPAEQKELEEGGSEK